MKQNARRCYIARYPLNEEKNDLREEIVCEDTYYSPLIRQNWEKLVACRKANEPMLQCWYSDEYAVELMAGTNQPYRLE